MKRRELKRQINEEFVRCTPQVLPQIEQRLGEMSPEQVSDEKIVSLDGYRKKQSPAKRILAVAAAVAVLLVSGRVGTGYLMPKAYVAIDVNPTVELKLNSRERVISAAADGLASLEDIQLRGESVDRAVELIIDSMIAQQYLSDEKNSVLLTVTGDADYNAMRERLSGEISSKIDSSLGTSAVMSQSLTQNAQLHDTATQYGISQGKVSLINSIIANDPTLKFEDLCKLSVNELNLLEGSRHGNNSPIVSSGKASSKAYIGESSAIAEAQKLVPGATVIECEMDYDNGAMVYEIELLANGTEYEIEINAKTGEHIKTESERAQTGSDPYDDDDDSDNDVDDENDDDDGYLENELDELEDKLDTDDDNDGFLENKLDQLEDIFDNDDDDND